jgi:type III secretory pathway component EscS
VAESSSPEKPAVLSTSMDNLTTALLSSLAGVTVGAVIGLVIAWKGKR